MNKTYKVHTDFDLDTITQEEALLCLARCPELLRVKIGKLKEKLSNIFGLSAVYDIPWNMVIVSSPSSLLMNPSHSAFIVESLTKYFDVERIRDVIGDYCQKNTPFNIDTT